MRIDLTSFRVLVGTLQPLSYWNLYGEQGRNLIITTPIIGDCIEPAYKTKTVQYILERGEFLYQKAQKKIPSSRWESSSRLSECIISMIMIYVL